MALPGFLRSAVPRWTNIFALTEGFVIFSIPFAAPLLSVAMLVRLRVTILGADATPGQINRLLDGGARDYLTKPLDFSKFMNLFQKTISTSEFRTGMTEAYAKRNHSE